MNFVVLETDDDDVGVDDGGDDDDDGGDDGEFERCLNSGTALQSQRQSREQRLAAELLQKWAQIEDYKFMHILKNTFKVRQFKFMQ